METETVERTQTWSAPSQSNAVVTATMPTQAKLVDPSEYDGWAEVFRKSGLFSLEGDPQTQLAQAKVKILAGQEMGLPPFFAMQQLYIVKGHIFVSAMAYGALINQPDADGVCRRKYKTVESNADKAVIEFYHLDSVSKQWELALRQSYTWDEVPQARRNNATYTTDRADMIWSRCMTKGGRKFAPEKVGGVRSLEDAADDAAFHELSGNGHESLIPEEPIVSATPQAETAADTPTPVATTKAEKPKRKAKATQAEPVPDTDLVDDALEPDGEQATADIADEPMTKEQKQDISFWMLSEKFPLENAIKAHGWVVPSFGAITQKQYHELKEDRDAYIRDCAEAFGWTLGPDLAITPEQRKELQERAAKNLRRA